MANPSVMRMLSDGVPITLLCDLAALTDPDSDAINSAERPADDPLWLEAAPGPRTGIRAITA